MLWKKNITKSKSKFTFGATYNVNISIRKYNIPFVFLLNFGILYNKKKFLNTTNSFPSSFPSPTLS